MAKTRSDESLNQSKVENPAVKMVAQIPKMTDPLWSDYVMTKFTPEELDPKGRPKVAGLRRVARDVLGPVMKSASEVVQSPRYVDNDIQNWAMHPAVVKHTYVFLWKGCTECGIETAFPVEYSAVASVHVKNLPDMNFLPYETAIAATRAEAIAIKKALQLNILAADEAGQEIERIMDAQITLLDRSFQIHDVDAKLFLEDELANYKSVKNIPLHVAVEAIKRIRDMTTKGSVVPADIKGYSTSWKD